MADCQFSIDPDQTTPYGDFGGRSFVAYRGSFTGTLPDGSPLETGFELVAPEDTASGEPTVVVEVAHASTGQPLAREACLLPDFLFGRGFRHAVLEDQRPEALAAFARCLRQEPPAVLGSVDRLYGVGFSSSGKVLLELLLQKAGVWLFDFSLPGTSDLPRIPRRAASRVLRLSSESDFRSLLRQLDPRTDRELHSLLQAEPERQPLLLESSRWYVVTAAPHIPDTEATVGAGPPGCRPPGSTPLDWTPVARAVFVAGNRWATRGAEPPASRLLRIDRGGNLIVDGNGHAVGGVRLPMLDLGESHVPEATFCAWPSLCDLAGDCDGVLGAFRDPRSLGDQNFLPDAEAYLTAFRQSARRLGREGFLLRPEVQALIERAEAAAAKGMTVTQAYAAVVTAAPAR